MFTFEWSEWVTDALLDGLYNIAGAGAGASRDREQLKEALVSVLRNTGGLPVTETAPSAAQARALAERLLAEALGHYLRAAAVRPAPPGHYLVDSKHPALDAELKSMPVIDVNAAEQPELEALPVIGEATAKMVMQERAARGYFASIEELVDRIDGLGAGAERTLRHLTIFRIPGAEPKVEQEGTPLEIALRRALQRFSTTDPSQRLLLAVQAVRAVTSRSAHPDTAQCRPRRLTDLTVSSGATAEFVGVLGGPAYYERLPAFLKEAAKTVDVAIFHAAFPGPAHPTKRLLDELIAARTRGVAVRVLLDRDRDTDPYMSTVVNAKAKRYLEENGVACKFDAEDVLLHSKYLVVDRELCIVGSHNWSAGSYSEFDDLSFVVRSDEMATALSARFDALWG